MKVKVRQREENSEYGPYGVFDVPVEVPVAGALTQEGVTHVLLVFDSGMVIEYSKGE